MTVLLMKHEQPVLFLLLLLITSKINEIHNVWADLMPASSNWPVF